MSLEWWQIEMARLQDKANAIEPKLIGKTWEEAIDMLKDDEDYRYRCDIADGKGMMVTCDYVTHRLNFELKNNIIVKIRRG